MKLMIAGWSMQSTRVPKPMTSPRSANCAMDIAVPANLARGQN